ncbi:MAG TPA: hypothetical protein VH143_33940 [Kofleriaceae bacterium]|nr:hypothetical protein [Kofleriaceae bacterium]
MTSLPDWLVERAALDEVPAAAKHRLDAADAAELDHRVGALRDDNARELAGYPVGPAIAQIMTRVNARPRRSHALRNSLLGIATAGAAVLAVAHFAKPRPAIVGELTFSDDDDGVRAKGKARLVAFRQVGDKAEQLEQDALCKQGDVIQLRYNAGGRRYGVIASVDGAGVVTLHYPLSEDAPPEATAVGAGTLALPHAYELDDAPRFERFFFITAQQPIDLPQSLAAIHALAIRDDSADAKLDLPQGLHQASLRLRKPDPTKDSQ